MTVTTRVPSKIKNYLTAMLLAGSTLLLTACPGGGDSDASAALLPLLASGSPATVPGGGGTINPGAPTSSPFSINASPGDGTVNLTWSYSGSGATHFVVYYSTAGDVSTASSKVVTSGTTMAFTHTGLTNGADYSYRVAAANDKGEGFLSSSTAKAGPDAWTAATSGTTNRFRAVRYLNNQFWAVGDNRTILRSSDGITWSTVAPGCGGASDGLYDIAHDGGTKFRIVGSNAVVYKSDNNGSTWSCGTFGANITYEGVYFANGLWIIAGNEIFTSNVVLGLSTDGDNFTGGSLASSSSFNALRDINYYAATGTYVVSGDDGIYGSCTTNCELTGSWSFGRITSFGFGVPFYGQYRRSNSYYFLGSSRVYRLNGSFTGLESFSEPTDANRSLDRGTEIMTVGDDGKIYTSSSSLGLFFVQRGQAATTSDLHGVACSPTRCVAGGDGGTLIYR